MFKTYNVADSLMQMNLFMALQVFRLSNLGYLAVARSFESEPEGQAEERLPTKLERRNAA